MLSSAARRLLSSAARRLLSSAAHIWLGWNALAA